MERTTLFSLLVCVVWVVLLLAAFIDTLVVPFRSQKHLLHLLILQFQLGLFFFFDFLIVFVNRLRFLLPSLLLLNRILRVLHSLRLEKLAPLLGFDVSMGSLGTLFDFFKLVPIIYDDIATGPPLLEVVEQGLAGVEIAAALNVFAFQIGLLAAISRAFLLDLLAHKYLKI